MRLPLLLLVIFISLCAPSSAAIPTCGPKQVMAIKDGKEVCADIPSCAKEQKLIFENGQYVCPNMPRCSRGEGLSFDGKTYICKPAPKVCPAGSFPHYDTKGSIASCEKTQDCTVGWVLMPVGGAYQCVKIPKCLAHESAAFNGKIFECKSPPKN